MKTKISGLIIGILSILLLANTNTFSQQAKLALPANNSNYSYKLYNAPNNMFGYDILENGKPVYHQFALLFISKEGRHIIATKQQTEKAARLAIDKIKKGQPPALSGKELQKIVAL